MLGVHRFDSGRNVKFQSSTGLGLDLNLVHTHMHAKEMLKFNTLLQSHKPRAFPVTRKKRFVNVSRIRREFFISNMCEDAISHHATSALVSFIIAAGENPI